jgi:hypothetical protein
VIHDPIDGLPMKFAPVFMSVIEGSWFGISAHIERTTQRSSATVPRCGQSSSSRPALAMRLNLNSDFIKLPVCATRHRPTWRRLAVVLSSIGFGSNVSTCDKPPFMNRR